MAALWGRTDYLIPRKKSVYSVHVENGKRTGTACAVERNGNYYLLTWCRPEQRGQSISGNRYCSQYPSHTPLKIHVQKNLSIPTSIGENGLTFIQLESEPEHILGMAKLPKNQEKIKAYTFQEKNIFKLKFKRSSRGKYKLETKSKRRIPKNLATGAPIIIKDAHTNERKVVGVLDDSHRPVLFKETTAGFTQATVHIPNLPSTSVNTQGPKRKKDPQPQARVAQGSQSLEQQSSNWEGNDNRSQSFKPSGKTQPQIKKTQAVVHTPNVPSTSANIQEHFDVKKYKEQLAKHYNKHMSYVQRAPWDPNDKIPIDEIYTRLSWVQEGKELRDYTELFKTNEDGTKVKRILIEGDAGMGKSTHAKKVAVDWARGENDFLKQFKLAIVLTLRKVCKMETLEEALKASEVFSIDDPPKFDDLYDYIKKHQEEVLFLFDGHDEYDPSDDVTTHITQIMEGSRLEECYVVVTTRPWRADKLKTHAFAHAKITGFSKDDVKNYCIKFLKNKEEADQLWHYLYSHDLMNTAKVPLLLLFYCLLWKETSTKILPEDKTELYKKTVECILNHNKCRAGLRAVEEMETYNKLFHLIGKVAFDALMKDTVLFEYKDLPKEVQSDDVLQLGFLSVTNIVAAYPKMKVSFLHKSLQEFLAAWYVTQRLAEFQEDLKKLENIKHFKNLSEFLMFVCGLSVEGSYQVFKRLKKVVIYDNTLLPSEPVPFEEMRKYFPDRLPLRLYQAAHPDAQLLTALLNCTGGVLSFQEKIGMAALKKFAQDLQNASKDHIRRMINVLLLLSPSSEDIQELRKAAIALDARVRVSLLGEDVRAGKFIAGLKCSLECSSNCHINFCSPCHPGHLCLYKSRKRIYLYFFSLTLSCDSYAKMFATNNDLPDSHAEMFATGSEFCDFHTVKFPPHVCAPHVVLNFAGPSSTTSMATCLSFVEPLVLSHLSEKTMKGIMETLTYIGKKSSNTPQVLLRHISLTGAPSTMLETSCNLMQCSYTMKLAISGRQTTIQGAELEEFINIISRSNLASLTLASLRFPSLSLEDLLRRVDQRAVKLHLDDIRVGADGHLVTRSCDKSSESESESLVENN